MSTNPAIQVILVPGADALMFAEDVAYARTIGAVVRELTLPPVEGHPIDGRLAYFDEVAGMIRYAVEAARNEGARAFGIGRNHGGSLLGYAAVQGCAFDGLVFSGVIPALSVYRAFSEQDSARKFRASLKGSDELERIVELRPHDLTTSLEEIDEGRCVLQIGTKDDWMDEDSFDCFRDLEERFNVQWFDDDHAMAAPETVAARWAFIQTLAERP